MIPRTPNLFSWLFPKILFRMPAQNTHTVYLTFDDGPHPEATGFVLDTLALYGAKGSFFSVGGNVERYPEIMERIRREGHALGHHTNRHLNARHIPKAEYLADVEAGALKNPSPYFRPPYGKLTFATYRALKNRYRIVLWDVLSEDYDERYTPQQCIDKVVRQVRAGSIIVLHDNPKCLHRLKVILPELMERFTKAGYAFGRLD